MQRVLTTAIQVLSIVVAVSLLRQPTIIFVPVETSEAPTPQKPSFGQGDLENTSRPLDVAIEGDGFFQVMMPNGETGYTRDGALRLNATGQLTSANGLLLQPLIAIPADALSITIGTDGTISVITAGSARATSVGNIQIARFIDPTTLRQFAPNLFSQSDASGTPILSAPGDNGYGTLQQGFLEQLDGSSHRRPTQMAVVRLSDQPRRNPPDNSRIFYRASMSTVR